MAAQPTPTRVVSSDGIFKAYVKLQGRETEVYQATEIDGICSKAWVVSNTGMAFSVHLDCNPLSLAETRGRDGTIYGDFCCYIHIDSKPQGGRLTHSGLGLYEMNFAGAQASEKELWPFRFNPSDQILDEHTKRLAKSVAESVGTIKLIITRVKALRPSRNSVYTRPEAIEHLNEADKKAKLPNIAGFGEPIRVHRATGWKVQTHPDDVNTPFYTFELGYRTSDVLQAMGIIDDPTKERIDHNADEAGVIDVDAGEQDISDSEDSSVEDGQEEDELTDQDGCGSLGAVDGGLELQAELEAHEARVLELRAQVEASRRNKANAGASKKKVTGKKRKHPATDGADNNGGSADEESKDNIIKQMRKRLKKRRKVDGGVVDLCLDD